MSRYFTWAFLLALGLGFTACNTLAAEDKDDDKDEQETTIKFSEAPEAVQKTFKEEAKGQKIETLTKEEEDGKTTYEAEVTIDGTKYEIEVGADGKLLEKEKADDDDHEDKDDDDAKEKADKK